MSIKVAFYYIFRKNFDSRLLKFFFLENFSDVL